MTKKLILGELGIGYYLVIGIWLFIPEESGRFLSREGSFCLLWADHGHTIIKKIV